MKEKYTAARVREKRWNRPLLTPAEEQEYAWVEMIGFDSSGEGTELWEANMAR